MQQQGTITILYCYVNKVCLCQRRLPRRCRGEASQATSPTLTPIPIVVLYSPWWRALRCHFTGLDDPAYKAVDPYDAVSSGWGNPCPSYNHRGPTVGVTPDNAWCGDRCAADANTGGHGAATSQTRPLVFQFGGGAGPLSRSAATLATLSKVKR